MTRRGSTGSPSLAILGRPQEMYTPLITSVATMSVTSISRSHTNSTARECPSKLSTRTGSSFT